MDGSRCDLFARAAFAGDHHGNIALRYTLHEREHLAHHLAGSDKLTGSALALHSCRETFGLASQLELTLGIVEQRFQLWMISQGLGQEVACSLLHGFDGHVDAALGGHQQNGPMRITGFQASQQFQTGSLRHHDVRDYDIRILPLHNFRRFAGIAGLQRLKSPILQKQRQRGRDGRIVIHDKDFSFSRSHANKYTLLRWERAGVRVTRFAK